jgi:hypothetical protein
MLFNNFWLNEIKNQDDGIRLIMNLNILLIGACATIIATNSEKIAEIIIIPIKIGAFTLTTLTVLFVAIIPPFLSWFISIDISRRSVRIPPQKAKPLLDTELAADYLANMFDYRHLIYVGSFSMTLFGVLYLMLLSEYTLLTAKSEWQAETVFIFASLSYLFLGILSTLCHRKIRRYQVGLGWDRSNTSIWNLLIDRT